jgi:hypothetical protein
LLLGVFLCQDQFELVAVLALLSLVLICPMRRYGIFFKFRKRNENNYNPDSMLNFILIVHDFISRK